MKTKQRALRLLTVMSLLTAGFHARVAAQAPPPPGSGPSAQDIIKNSVTTTTMGESGLMQNAAASDMQSSSGGGSALGVVLGVGATSFATYRATLACASKKPSCFWWVAGAAAAGVVTVNMATARDKSANGYQAVTVPSASYGGNTNPQAQGIPGLESDPAWQQAQKNINDLKAMGYKIDMNSGDVTLPNGQKILGSSLKNEASMRASGMSSADIKQFADIMSQAEKAGKEYAAKAADSTAAAAFDDTIGGGAGGATAGGAAETAMEMQAPTASEPRLPANVKGMVKMVNGEPMGVAADSLFDMMNRRYQVIVKKDEIISAAPVVSQGVAPAGP